MKAIVIAEFCQNHNGDKGILQEMIYAAAESGADYAKIQSIRSSELSYRERFENGIISETGEVQVIRRPYQDELNRLKRLDISIEEEAWFVEECIKAGIAPMTTVFTRSTLREIEGIGFEALKIASYDCSSYQLLRECVNVSKNIFISTGATYDNEIAKAVQILSGVNLHLLHAVTLYPTPLNQLHLSRLNYLRRFTSNVGYSDHSHVETTGLVASFGALALGASCVERHFTILPSAQTKDGPVSINPNQLVELVNFSRLSRRDQVKELSILYPNWIKEFYGIPNRALSKEELLNRDYYKGRFASKVNNNVIFNWEEIDI